MAEYARDAGVQDIAEFQSCLESNKYASVVRDNYNLALSIGLNGTPKFLVLKDGHEPATIPGALPYSAFQQVLDSIV
jgi:protein-disulfide isomerase